MKRMGYKYKMYGTVPMERHKTKHFDSIRFDSIRFDCFVLFCFDLSSSEEQKQNLASNTTSIVSDRMCVHSIPLIGIFTNHPQTFTHSLTQAECDDEGEFRIMNENDSSLNQKTSEAIHNNNSSISTPINAQHVTRIAGDLLMDFSWPGTKIQIWKLDSTRPKRKHSFESTVSKNAQYSRAADQNPW